MENYLALVNKKNRINEDMVKGFEYEKLLTRQGNEEFIEKQTLLHFKNLQQEMKNLGIDVSVNSAGRTILDQERIYKELLQEQGKEYADSHTAKPYYSEHHLGLALDVHLEWENPNILKKITSRALRQNDLFKVLHKNLSQFGFIYRYQPSKTKETGYPGERWHIRYVGPEAAKYITNKNITLEEYVEQIERVKNK